MNPDPTSLDRLHDILAPPPAPWWPPAVGWLWLAALMLVLCVVAAWRLLIQWQRNRYRREALAELRAIASVLAAPERRAAGLAALAELLKRAALSAYPRGEVASLTGADWLAFLARTAPSGSLDAKTGAALEHAAYGIAATTEIDAEQAHAAMLFSRRWLKAHRGGALVKGGAAC